MKLSVLETLQEIKDFINWCQKDKELAGFNVVISQTDYGSYILGKTYDSLKAKYVLPIDLDYTDPIQRPLIANAIHEALYRESMTAEEMENEMVSKSEDIQ